MQNETLTLTEKALSSINTARKWTLFLAILSFISLGFVAIAGVVMLIAGIALKTQGNIPFQFPFIILSIFYLILAAVGFIPTVYLYNFSKNAKTLVLFREQEKVEETFDYLGRYYKFIGIATIVILALYILMIPAFMFFSLSAQHLF